MIGKLNGIRNHGLAHTSLRLQGAREAVGETAASTDEVQLSSASQMAPAAHGLPQSRPGKVRNLALQVATALVFGCAGLALVGCGVSSEVESLKTVTTELSQQGNLSKPVCEKVRRQVGPDWLPLTSKVMECNDKHVSPEEAAKLLAQGKEVNLVRYQKGLWEIPMGDGRAEVLTEMRVRETMKSTADALALQARLGQAESR